jgi:hypothetical protein
VATLVYSPAIRVRIASEKNGIIDISEDISSWEMIRRSNTVSSFNFVLQNTQRKYDRVFRPADRITVDLKRITWVTVFSGTMNNVPIFSSWPRSLSLSASCTLKKLQFWPWDPTTQAAVEMIANHTPTLQAASTKGDAGLSGLITQALTDVCDWNPKGIHIGAVPNAWFRWAQDTETSINNASNMAVILGSHSTIGGVANLGTIKLKAGDWAGFTLDQAQVNLATSIYAAVLGQAGLSKAKEQDRAALIALMVVGDESSFAPADHAVDGTSLGPYQQLDAWGPASVRQDIEGSTKLFLFGGQDHQPGLFDKDNWKTGIPWEVAQSVQGSGAGDHNHGANYQAWYPTAIALVEACRKKLTAAVTKGGGNLVGGGDAPNQGLPTGGTKFLTTGDVFAKVAYDLINDRPKYAIKYSQERGTHASDPTNDNPTRLDCSSLVSWVTYHATGKIWAGTNTGTQWPLCKIKIDYDMAANIRGCLYFNLAGGSPEHVAVSLGNGLEVAAHDEQMGVVMDSIVNTGCNSAALHPEVDYTAAATNEKARAYLQKKLGKPCTISPATSWDAVQDPSQSNQSSDQNQSDDSPFGQLINVLGTNPVASGNIFGGPRELINNQYLLPWITNLTNSSMRAFCSAPNGDFMAWFPDYYNVWNTAAIMKIKQIELMDFTVEWSDQQIVTHEFVLGSMYSLLDQVSGGIVDGSSESYSTLSSMLSTEGIASLDFPQIFKTIYGKTAKKHSVHEYLKRFGARPNVESFPNIMHGPQEFYMALWQFMKHWSEQFNATIPMTFMPELYPGMLIQIDAYDFQAYVTEVTHRGSYGQGGKFVTEAKIIAPSTISKTDKGQAFGMLDF